MAGLLDFMTGGGDYSDPNKINATYGVPEAMVRNAGIDTLANISSALLAAGMAPRNQRGQMLAQLGPAMGTFDKSLYNAAQQRLMSQNLQEKQQELKDLEIVKNEMTNNPQGIASQLGMTVDQIKQFTPKDLRQVMLQTAVTKASRSPLDEEVKRAQIAASTQSTAASAFDVQSKKDALDLQKQQLNTILQQYGLPPITPAAPAAGAPAGVSAPAGMNVPPPAAAPSIGAQPAPAPAQPAAAGGPPPVKRALTPEQVSSLITAGFKPHEIAQLEVQQQLKAPELAQTQEQKMFERSNVLRDEFNKQTEKFADRQANYKTMEQLAKQGEGASDIALIFSLMKVYDPTSTVTSGEAANAQNSAGVPEAIRSQWNMVTGGGKLSDKARNDLVNAARQRFDQELDVFGSAQDRYKKLAERNKIDPENVVSDLRDPDILAQRTRQKLVESATKKAGPMDLLKLDAVGLQLLDPTIMTEKQKQAYDVRLQQLQQLESTPQGSEQRYRPMPAGTKPSMFQQWLKNPLFY
jgi:hypothetical protein